MRTGTQNARCTGSRPIARLPALAILFAARYKGFPREEAAMHAVVITEPGGPEVLQWTEVEDPVPGAGEVLVDVAASAVNRADLMQRQGLYPPPPGAPPYPGLECLGHDRRDRTRSDGVEARRRGVRAAFRRRLRREGRRPRRPAPAGPGTRRA